MDVIQWLIEGFPVGCVYALVAIGLVLTYKTTGVFNLAFSAQAFFSAWIMFDFVEIHHRPLWLGFVVSVLIAAPALGFVLDRGLFRYMRTASGVVKLVTRARPVRGDPRDREGASSTSRRSSARRASPRCSGSPRTRSSTSATTWSPPTG